MSYAKKKEEKKRHEKKHASYEKNDRFCGLNLECQQQKKANGRMVYVDCVLMNSRFILDLFDMDK